MQQRSVIRSILITLCVLTAAAPITKAGVFENVGRGLGLAGFDVVGQRNILSDGIELSVRRNLLGNPLDFGIGELTLRGPISLELNTGQRVMNTLDLNFQTAISRDQVSTPLTYDFVVDVGGQQTSVSGQLFIDAGLSINEFGFYDLQLQYSSRQNIVRDGRFASEDSQMDFDAGPINVRGNIFADILAVITAPIFDATGGTNVFASFSGSAQLRKALEKSRGAFADYLASGLETTDATLASAAFDSTLSGQSDWTGQIDPIGGLATSRSIIPEPTVLLLMLAGIPAILRRRRALRSS